jgi:uncharacterized protein (TIGR00730 family)
MTAVTRHLHVPAIQPVAWGLGLTGHTHKKSVRWQTGHGATIRPMPTQLSSIAVYCGSNPGFDPVFTSVTASLGRLMAERGIRLVYGGAHVGLMGTIADAVLDNGGEAHGVITRALEQTEIPHRGLNSLRVTDTMHERKAAMADAADAFIMLPGGYGTFDEFFEVLTWTQLGIHAKPCAILDVAGFFDPLRTLLDGAVTAGFVRPAHRDMVIIDTDPARLLDQLAAWTPVQVSKWLDRSERLSPAAGETGVRQRRDALGTAR